MTAHPLHVLPGPVDLDAIATDATPGYDGDKRAGAGNVRGAEPERETRRGQSRAEDDEDRRRATR